MEKDEILEEYIPNNNYIDNNKVNDEKDQSMYRVMNKDSHVETEQEENSIYNKLDMQNHKMIQENPKENDNKQYENLNNEHIGKMIYENNARDIESNNNSSNQNNLKIIKNANIESQAKETNSKERGDIELARKGTNETSKALFSKNQAQNSFRIAFIFSIIQMSDVILFNFYVLKLFLPLNRNGFDFTLTTATICLMTIHIFHTSSNHFIKNFLLKLSNKGNKTTKRALIINLIISIVVTNLYVASLLFTNSKENYTDYLLGKFLLSSLFYLIRNISNTNCLTCYTILITRIDNSKIKEKINYYHTYHSYLLRAISSFIATFLILFITYSLKNSMFFFLVSLMSSTLISLVFILIKHI
jgi:hypothetical protein